MPRNVGRITASSTRLFLRCKYNYFEYLRKVVSINIDKVANLLEKINKKNVRQDLDFEKKFSKRGIHTKVFQQWPIKVL